MIYSWNEKEKKWEEKHYHANWDVVGELHRLEYSRDTEALKKFLGQLTGNDWGYLMGQLPYFRLGRLGELRYGYKKEHNRIMGIPVAYESADELSRLVKFLNESGYTGYTEGSGPRVLYTCWSDGSYSRPNVTSMACWCSGKRYPLSVDQFIENYTRIVIDDDVDYYDRLTRERYQEKDKTSKSV